MEIQPLGLAPAAGKEKGTGNPAAPQEGFNEALERAQAAPPEPAQAGGPEPPPPVALEAEEEVAQVEPNVPALNLDFLPLPEIEDAVMPTPFWSAPAAEVTPEVEAQAPADEAVADAMQWLMASLNASAFQTPPLQPTAVVALPETMPSTDAPATPTIVPVQTAVPTVSLDSTPEPLPMVRPTAPDSGAAAFVLPEPGEAPAQVVAPQASPAPTPEPMTETAPTVPVSSTPQPALPTDESVPMVTAQVATPAPVATEKPEASVEGETVESIANAAVAAKITTDTDTAHDGSSDDLLQKGKPQLAEKVEVPTEEAAPAASATPTVKSPATADKAILDVPTQESAKPVVEKALKAETAAVEVTTEKEVAPTAVPLFSPQGESEVPTTTSVTTTAAKPLAPREVDAVIKQVTERIEFMAAARPRDGVTVHLRPADLGNITLVVKSIGSIVNAEILASNDQVRQALENSRPQLQEAMQQRGMQLQQVTFGQPQGQTGNSDQSFARQEMQFAQQQQNQQSAQQQSQGQPSRPGFTDGARMTSMADSAIDPAQGFSTRRLDRGVDYRA